MTLLLKRKFAITILRLFGWTMHGAPPQDKRCVLVAAPHTSNWDFPLLMLFAAAYGLKISWFAKKSLFNPLTGGAMRAMGGVAVDRASRHNLVAQMANRFSSQTEFILVVPTEATRKRSEYWRSGFYQIATEAQVPVVPTYLDFEKKQGGFGKPVWPTGDVKNDMQYFREFYQDKKGRFPDQFGPVRLKEEIDSGEQPNGH